MSARVASLVLAVLAGGCNLTGLENHSRFRIGYGYRDFRSGAWGELSDHRVIETSLAVEPPDWPLGVEAGLAFTHDSGDVGGNEHEVLSVEAFAGPMRSFELVRGRLFAELGAGLAGVSVEEDDDPLFGGSDTEEWLSLYGRASLRWRFWEDFTLSLDARLNRGGEADLYGRRRTGDYDQLVLSFGAGW